MVRVLFRQIFCGFGIVTSATPGAGGFGRNNHANMDATAKNLLNLQREEATLCEVYRRLAELEKDPVRRQTLVRIMHDERRHCAILKRRTGREMAPDPKRVFWYVWIMRVLGPAFVVRQMELCEKGTEASYSLYAEREEFIRIASEEKRHRGGSDQPGRRNAAVLYEFGGIGPERRSGRIHGGAGRVHACAERTAARGAYGQHHRCRRRPFDGRFRIPFDQIGRCPGEASAAGRPLYRNRLPRDGRHSDNSLSTFFEPSWH